MNWKNNFVYYVTIVALVPVVIILFPLFGGASGWLFAWIFPDSFKAMQEWFGTQASGFEIGAIFGFIAGFLGAISKGSSK